MATKVGGELYYSLDGQLAEIKRQLRQPNGYPFDPEGLQKHLQAAIEGRFEVNKPEPPLLELVGTVKLIATAKQFVASDKFVVDTSDKADLPISYLGTNFKDWFLGKIEEPAGESALRCQRLRRPEKDGPIIAELGGKDKAEITLGQLYAFLKQADKDKWFVCYIRNKNGVLCAVNAGRHDGGWHVGARSVGDPNRWFEGYQVLSPQFLSS